MPCFTVVDVAEAHTVIQPRRFAREDAPPLHKRGLGLVDRMSRYRPKRQRCIIGLNAWNRNWMLPISHPAHVACQSRLQHQCAARLGSLRCKHLSRLHEVCSCRGATSTSTTWTLIGRHAVASWPSSSSPEVLEEFATSRDRARPQLRWKLRRFPKARCLQACRPIGVPYSL